MQSYYATPMPCTDTVAAHWDGNVTLYFSRQSLEALVLDYTQSDAWDDPSAALEAMPTAHLIAEAKTIFPGFSAYPVPVNA